MPNPNYDDEPGEGSEKEATGHVALLPKSVLMGKDFKVGEEVVLKITAIRGNEVEVEYAPAEPSEPEHPDDEPATVPEGEGEPTEEGVGEQAPADMMNE